MSSANVTARPVLADLLPRVAVRDVLLVLAGTLLTAAAAQVVIPLPFTPVPISGQTFAVLLAGAALGPARGLVAMSLYVVLGVAGLPFYADGASGLTYALGATGGYLLGFVLAAWIVGQLARRGLDRKPWGTALAFIIGSAAIYAVGAPWLAVVSELSIREALRLGVVPFLLGDAIKATLAAVMLPLAWKAVGDREHPLPGGQ